MGDFCISGFYSKLPIHRETKVIGIICKVNKASKSNYPCYLKNSELTPIALPIVGIMGDYGNFDDYEESETTRLLEKVTGLSFDEITETILRTSEFYPTFSARIENNNKYKEYTNKKENGKLEKMKSLYNIYKYDADKIEPEFRIIFEHYDVYKVIAGNNENSFLINSINKLSEVKNKLNNFIKEHNIEIPNDDFRTNNIFCSSSLGKSIPGTYSGLSVMGYIFNDKNISSDKEKGELIDMYNSLINEFYIFETDNRGYKNRVYETPGEYISNYISNMEYKWFMGLYEFNDYEYNNMTSEIVDWCQFLYVFDNICHGSFCYSGNTGQNWHHDKDYWETRTQLLNTYNNIIDEYLTSCSEDDWEDSDDFEYNEDIESDDVEINIPEGFDFNSIVID